MKKSFGFAKTAALMGVIILAAKLMGLVRDVMVAGVFGTSVYAVAYETASRLPVTIFDFVLGGTPEIIHKPDPHPISRRIRHSLPSGSRGSCSRW